MNSPGLYLCLSVCLSACVFLFVCLCLSLSLSLYRILVEFSPSNFYMPPCVAKFFKFMEFTFLENALIRGIFTCITPHSKLAPNFLSSRPRQKKVTHSPRQQKKVKETTICFIKIQSENMKMTWNIRFFIFGVTCNFFKCDGFSFLNNINI